jgi:hypothetical protein
MCDKTVKEKYLGDVPIPNSHKLHPTTIGKLQKHTHWIEQLIIIWQMNAVQYSAISTIQNWEYSQKLHGSLTLLSPCLGLCIFV